MGTAHEETAAMLAAARAGDREALDRLYDATYGELRRIARGHLRRGRRGGIDTTSLVHEAYVKLFDRSTPDFGDRAHFLALSARAMRQILVDHFRARMAAKRGGGVEAVTLEEDLAAGRFHGEVLLAVHEALEALAAQDARTAKVVECKFFGGMTEEEIASALGVTTRTVSSDWRAARAWMTRRLGTGSPTQS